MWWAFYVIPYVLLVFIKSMNIGLNIFIVNPTSPNDFKQLFPYHFTPIPLVIATIIGVLQFFYFPMATFCVWRCSTNVRHSVWGIITRLFLIIAPTLAIFYIFFSPFSPISETTPAATLDILGAATRATLLIEGILILLYLFNGLLKLCRKESIVAATIHWTVLPSLLAFIHMLLIAMNVCLPLLM